MKAALLFLSGAAAIPLKLTPDGEAIDASRSRATNLYPTPLDSGIGKGRDSTSNAAATPAAAAPATAAATTGCLPSKRLQIVTIHEHEVTEPVHIPLVALNKIPIQHFV